MRVWIVGPGAVGTVIGGLLAQAGHEITFVPRRPPSAAAGEAGIRLVLPDRWLSFRPQNWLSSVNRAETAGSRAAGVPPADLIVVALRRDHLAELRRAPLRGHIPGVDPPPTVEGDEQAPPVLFLNADPQQGASDSGRGGRGGVRRTDRQAEGRALRALTLWTSVRLQPETVELVSPRPVFLTERDPRLKPVGTALRACGIEVVEADSIEPYGRALFLLQLLFLPIALCHSTCEHFLSYPEGREIAASVLGEGLRTMERAGEELRKLPTMDPQELLARLRKGGGAADRGRYAPDRGYNGVLQAILRREKTEVPELNERLVKRASEAGVEATWNWRLAGKLSRVVQVGFYRDPAELYRALA